MAVDKKEHTLVSGTKSGEVIVWRNSNFDCLFEGPSQTCPWVKIKHLNEHSKMVTHIFISDEMNLFCTSSMDGTIFMHNLWTADLIRSFQHPHFSPVNKCVIA